MKLREEFEKIERLDDLLFEIKKNCEPFLNEINPIGRFIYRGSDRKFKDYTVLKSYLDERIPKNMPKKAHDYLNKGFKKKFGWPVRNGIFVSFDPTVAANYGEAYLFFPVGKYKYAYSKRVLDLYEDYYTDLHIFNATPTNLGKYKFDLGKEHEEKYGSRTKKGVWLYKGKGKKLFVKGNTSIPDAIEKFKKILKVDDTVDILKDIVWVPKISLDDYTKEYIEKEKKRVYSILDDVVDNYESKSLNDAKHVEISFNCERYYLVEYAWKNLLSDELLT